MPKVLDYRFTTNMKQQKKSLKEIKDFLGFSSSRVTIDYATNKIILKYGVNAFYFCCDYYIIEEYSGTIRVVNKETSEDQINFLWIVNK